MAEIMRASQEWKNRPDDQRFVSLTDLHAYTSRERAHSSGLVIPSKSLGAYAVGDGTADGSIVVRESPTGADLRVSNWSFGQLAQRAGAPAGYLRELPAPLAADCVNWGLASRPVEDVGAYIRHANGAPPSLLAVTGPKYGRVWNADVTGALVQRFGDGVTGAFRVPGIFGKPLERVTKEATTLYASDRDMFVFLADEEHRIEVPNRRNGQPGSLARGFMVWNSEVGASTLGIALFLFDYVCANRIVWGAEGYAEIRVRHTASAPDRFFREVAPAVERFAAASQDNVMHALEAARTRKLYTVPDERAASVAAFLTTRQFTRSQIAAMETIHVAEEGRPIETAWDAATAATAYARQIPHTDTRVGIERAAGAILTVR